MTEIYRDEMIAITQSSDGYYIRSFKKGLSLQRFSSLLQQFPRIQISNYETVRKALNEAPFGPELFAIEKERMTVEISPDQLQVWLILNIPSEELETKSRNALIHEVYDALKKANVTYGILSDALKGELSTGKHILIARGLKPVPGKDSEIKLYEVSEPKPTVIDNGQANFYDLNLIHQVQTGEWLGERLDPTPGIPGRTVLDTEIAPVNGELLPLHYDRNSIEVVREDGKDVLYSLKSGAVHFVDKDIAVYDVMEINGNVDFSTGNIDFSGYVSIKGSVEENFSVRAGKDIEISGEYGIGGVNTIESREGSIYIRGGIAGKDKAKIICKKNLYVKYLADVEVTCEGNVYVGFYIRNSKVRAKQIIVDSPRGQITGGLTDAEIKVECANIGNWTETRTHICVRGFNRGAMQSRMEQILALILEKKEQLVKLKKMIPAGKEQKSESEYSRAQKIRQALLQVSEDVRALEAERLNIINFMKTPGEGAVIVNKRIYPRVKLVIQGETMEVFEEGMASTYIVRDGMIQPI